MKKPLLAILSAIAALTCSATGAIIFSGGTGGQPVVMTITEDITFTINRNVQTQYLGLVIKNVYTTGPGYTMGDVPPTNYSSAGSIKATNGSQTGSGYYSTGTLDFSYNDLKTRDFLLTITRGQGWTFTNGSQVTIHAGSVTMTEWVLLPDKPVTSVLLVDGGVVTSISGQVAVVPEPAAMLLGSMGMIALLRRRR